MRVEVERRLFFICLPGVLPADSGTVSVDGTSLHLLTESQRDQLRVGKNRICFSIVQFIEWFYLSGKYYFGDEPEWFKRCG